MNHKQALFEHLALVARGLASAARLELLDFLAQGERSVEDLARAAGLSIANTSKHLQQLKGAGLVTPRRDGKHIYYRLADERVLDAIATLRRLAETHQEAVAQLIASRGAPSRIAGRRGLSAHPRHRRRHAYGDDDPRSERASPAGRRCGLDQASPDTIIVGSDGNRLPNGTGRGAPDQAHSGCGDTPALTGAPNTCRNADFSASSYS
jgi:DNA-binding transcriptional ArsR family regulator